MIYLMVMSHTLRHLPSTSKNYVNYISYHYLCVLFSSNRFSANQMPLSTTAWDIDLADHRSLELFFEHFEQTLVDLNFLDPENPRQAMTRFRRLFQRIHMDQMEVGLLRGVLSAAQRYCK